MKKQILLPLGIVFLMLLAFFFYQQVGSSPSYHGSFIQTPVPAPEFTLQTDHGPLRLEDLRGRFVLLYFGYTFCPDVCPATLSTVKRALQNAGDAADQFQLVFVSVDPRRDTPERMGEYVRFYHPTFIGATAPEPEIGEIAARYGIHYELNDAEDKVNYTVNHTSVVIAIDPQGNQRLVWPGEIESADLAADLKLLARGIK
jgi:protein SCO1/2